MCKFVLYAQEQVFLFTINDVNMFLPRFSVLTVSHAERMITEVYLELIPSAAAEDRC